MNEDLLDTAQPLRETSKHQGVCGAEGGLAPFGAGSWADSRSARGRPLQPLSLTHACAHARTSRAHLDAGGGREWSGGGREWSCCCLEGAACGLGLSSHEPAAAATAMEGEEGGRELRAGCQWRARAPMRAASSGVWAQSGTRQPLPALAARHRITTYLTAATIHARTQHTLDARMLACVRACAHTRTHCASCANSTPAHPITHSPPPFSQKRTAHRRQQP